METSSRSLLTMQCDETIYQTKLCERAASNVYITRSTYKKIREVDAPSREGEEEATTRMETLLPGRGSGQKRAGAEK